MSGVKALVQRLEKSQGFGSAAKRNALNAMGSPTHQTSTPIKSAGITQPQQHPSPKVQGWCVQVEVISGRDLPPHNKSSAYACASLVGSGTTVETEDGYMTLDHNVSKITLQEHLSRNATPPRFNINAQMRTRTVRMEPSSLQPEWRDRFMCSDAHPDVPPFSDLLKGAVPGENRQRLTGQALKCLITVHTADPVGGDKFVGRLVLDAVPGQPIDGWHELRGRDGKPVLGRNGNCTAIQLKLVYEHRGDAAKRDSEQQPQHMQQPNPMPRERQQQQQQQRMNQAHQQPNPMPREQQQQQRMNQAHQQPQQQQQSQVAQPSPTNIGMGDNGVSASLVNVPARAVADTDTGHSTGGDERQSQGSHARGPAVSPISSESVNEDSSLPSPSSLGDETLRLGDFDETVSLLPSAFDEDRLQTPRSARHAPNAPIHQPSTPPTPLITADLTVARDPGLASPRTNTNSLLMPALAGPSPGGGPSKDMAQSSTVEQQWSGPGGGAAPRNDVQNHPLPQYTDVTNDNIGGGRDIAGAGSEMQVQGNLLQVDFEGGMHGTSMFGLATSPGAKSSPPEGGRDRWRGDESSAVGDAHRQAHSPPPAAPVGKPPSSPPAPKRPSSPPAPQSRSSPSATKPATWTPPANRHHSSPAQALSPPHAPAAPSGLSVRVGRLSGLPVLRGRYYCCLSLLPEHSTADSDGQLIVEHAVESGWVWSDELGWTHTPSVPPTPGKSPSMVRVPPQYATDVSRGEWDVDFVLGGAVNEPRLLIPAEARPKGADAVGDDAVGRLLVTLHEWRGGAEGGVVVGYAAERLVRGKEQVSMTMRFVRPSDALPLKDAHGSNVSLSIAVTSSIKSVEDASSRVPESSQIGIEASFNVDPAASASAATFGNDAGLTASMRGGVQGFSASGRGGVDATSGQLQRAQLEMIVTREELKVERGRRQEMAEQMARLAEQRNQMAEELQREKTANAALRSSVEEARRETEGIRSTRDSDKRGSAAAKEIYETAASTLQQHSKAIVARYHSIARGDANLNYELLGATRELDECREECEKLVLNISLAIESLLSLAFINSAVTVDSLAKQKASRAEATDALKVLTERDPQDMWTHRAVERAATNISSALSRLQYEQGVLSSIHSQAGRTNEQVLKRFVLEIKRPSSPSKSPKKGTSDTREPPKAATVKTSLGNGLPQGGRAGTADAPAGDSSPSVLDKRGSSNGQGAKRTSASRTWVSGGSRHRFDLSDDEDEIVVGGGGEAGSGRELIGRKSKQMNSRDEKMLRDDTIGGAGGEEGGEEGGRVRLFRGTRDETVMRGSVVETRMREGREQRDDRVERERRERMWEEREKERVRRQDASSSASREGASLSQRGKSSPREEKALPRSTSHRSQPDAGRRDTEGKTGQGEGMYEELARMEREALDWEQSRLGQSVGTDINIVSNPAKKHATPSATTPIHAHARAARETSPTSLARATTPGDAKSPKILFEVRDGDWSGEMVAGPPARPKAISKSVGRDDKRRMAAADRIRSRRMERARMFPEDDVVSPVPQQTPSEHDGDDGVGGLERTVAKKLLDVDTDDSD